MLGQGRFKNIEEWPMLDRAAWQHGISPERLLHGSGPALHIRPATLSKYKRAYACWLQYLESNNASALEEDPSRRVSTDNIDGYRSYLEAAVSPVTVRLRLTDLEQALRIITPLQKYPSLHALPARFPKKGNLVRKRQRMVESEELYQLGLELMAIADAKSCASRWDAVKYRDGLMICLLARRAMRLRNLTHLTIGKSIREINGSFVLDLRSAERKAHDHQLEEVPESLAGKLRRYLAIYRPMLLRDRADDDRLWLSQRPGSLTDSGIYYAIIARTKAAFGGSGINPHLFRDCLATSIALHFPDQIRSARFALGNSFATMQGFYNQAKSFEASMMLNAGIAKRRKRKKSADRGA